MIMDDKLYKYRNLQWISQVNNKSFILEDIKSFTVLDSIQEAIYLSTHIGSDAIIVFYEEMLVLKGHKVKEFTVYFLVHNGQLEYAGLTPPKTIAGIEYYTQKSVNFYPEIGGNQRRFKSLLLWGIIAIALLGFMYVGLQKIRVFLDMPTKSSSEVNKIYWKTMTSEQRRNYYWALKDLLQNGQLDSVSKMLERLVLDDIVDDSLSLLQKQLGQAYLRRGLDNITTGNLSASQQNLERAQRYLGINDSVLQKGWEIFRKAEREKWLNMFDWVWVEGGSFYMGCTSEQSDCDDDEKPVHTVSIDGFYITKYEVTFSQYDEYCEMTGRRKPNDEGWGRGNRPVINVTWYEAVDFCKWLSEKTGTTIRLPTEAEWEYAARGGQRSRGFKYAGSNNVDSVAWYKGNSGGKTHPVGQKQPNELGLYDMSGNVWEWCMDWYDKNYYSQSPQKNPFGPLNGTSRIDRGGSWFGDSVYVRVSNRSYYRPTYGLKSLGFRIVREK